MIRFLAAMAMMLYAASQALAVDVAVVDKAEHDISAFVGYAPDRIVVRFDAPTLRMLDRGAFGRGRTGIPLLDQVGERHGAVSIRAQFPGAGVKVYRGNLVDLSGWHKVKFAGKVDPLAVVEEYRKMPGVIDAQAVSIHTAYRTPNDGFYGYQWHLPRIQAPQAWDTQTGSRDVIVAVPDTGVRYFHKDLGGVNASYDNFTAIDGNMWINQAEKTGLPNVDDDGTGKVDDWIGWDFVENTTTGMEPLIYCYPGEDCATADNDPRDFNGHGTHVAGIVAAMGNNGYAVASVAGGWGNGTLEAAGNGVRVMPLRVGWSAVYVFFEVGLVAMDYAAEALVYAADHGARIASCSWGSEDAGGIGAAIDYFLASGGLIFKAAGNDSSETPDYMGSRADIINVAATDQSDCKADFSTYGSWVGISSPGVDIWSLYHVHDDPAGEYVATLDGTSMSSPLAAGVAALIWSGNPTWLAGQVKERLYGSADPIDALACNSSYAGKLGAGRVNAYKAVTGSTPPPGNAAPVAVNDSYGTNEDTALSVPAPGVLGNDTDADGNPLTALLVSGPSHGTLTLNTNGSFGYSPALNYNGPDSFTYKANDGTADSNPATVTITVNPVNDPPVAVNDSVTTRKNKSVRIKVVANDYDLDGAIDPATVTVLAQPANGAATANTNGTVTYTPNRSFTGGDSFDYTVKDNNGAVSNAATVTVTVTAR